MSDEDAPKSAYDLAMEKLRARGDFEETKLTDAQKAEIGELRSRTRAKIAELEIQQESKLRAVTSYEELDKLKAELAREKEHLNEELEAKVAAVRERK